MFRKYLKIIDRYIVVIALLAITCGVVGQYMMAWDYLWSPDVDEQYMSEYADPSGKVIAPLEPLAKGLKVVSGFDNYIYHENEFHSVWQRVGYHVFEVGRWLGYIVFFRTIIWLIHASFTTLDEERKARGALKRGEDVIAVHGGSVYAAALAKNLVNAGFTVSVTDAKVLSALGDKAPANPTPMAVAIKAPRQVVMFEDDRDAIQFLEQNGDAMTADAHVYVHLDDLVPTGMFDDHMTPFSIAMICASLYWANYPVFLTHTNGVGGALPDPVELSRDLARPLAQGPRYRVVIIGDTDFTEQILEVGLLANISDVTGGIRYDVIGDISSWRSMHPGLDAAVAMNADEVRFHTGAWYEHRELLHAADRVILCGDSVDNVRIAVELQSEPLRKLHVRVNNKGSLLVLGEHAKEAAGPTEVEVFGTLDQVCTPGLVTQDDANARGKLREVLNVMGTARCNGCETFDFSAIADAPEGDVLDEELCQKIRAARLARIQEADETGLNRCLACPRFRDAWQRRDGLARQNNYADTYHFSQKYRLLYLMGVPVRDGVGIAEKTYGFAHLPAEAKEALREIEHIRWCRFYLLNGWTYAPGHKNPRARTHPEIVPYAGLGDETKRLKFDNGYLNVCQAETSQAMQDWIDSVWLGNEDEEQTPGATAESPI